MVNGSAQLFRSVERIFPRTSIYHLRFTIYHLLDVGDLFNGCDDLFHTWYCRVLEILGVGHRHVGAGNAFDWSIEIIKSPLHNFGGDLGRDAAKWMRLF